MALREIVLHPDPRLRIECGAVKEVNDDIRTLLNDMAETMYAAPGIGLAAPQIGELVRVIVVDVGLSEQSDEPAKLYKIVNPEITDSEGETETEEFPTATERFIYVIRGSLKIIRGEDETLLNERESLYFNAARPHYFVNSSDTEIECLSVITPVSL